METHRAGRGQDRVDRPGHAGVDAAIGTEQQRAGAAHEGAGVGRRIVAGDAQDGDALGVLQRQDGNQQRQDQIEQCGLREHRVDGLRPGGLQRQLSLERELAALDRHVAGGEQRHQHRRQDAGDRLPEGEHDPGDQRGQRDLQFLVECVDRQEAEFQEYAGDHGHDDRLGHEAHDRLEAAAEAEQDHHGAGHHVGADDFRKRVFEQGLAGDGRAGDRPGEGERLLVEPAHRECDGAAGDEADEDPRRQGLGREPSGDPDGQDQRNRPGRGEEKRDDGVRQMVRTDGQQRLGDFRLVAGWQFEHGMRRARSDSSHRPDWRRRTAGAR